MLLENIREAISNLVENRMRSLLTMLGIIIGISSVITITTIGASIKSTISATMNSIGGNSIQAYVEPYYPEEEVDWETWSYPEMKEEDYITQDMLEELRERYPDEILGYVINKDVGTGQIYENADTYANVNVTGCTPEYLEYTKLDLIRGRNITPLDQEKKKRVCVVADTMAGYYFGETDPIGQQVTFNTSDGKSFGLTIVGVYEYNVSVFGHPDTSVPEKDRMTSVFIPVTAADSIMGTETAGYDSVTIVPKTGADNELVKSDLNVFFEEKYGSNENWHVSILDMSSDMDVIDTVINVITVAISFIAAISLIVGGVGVMNIMLVSITERTKEIGIRKAMGAKNRTIRQQFLIESVVLCLMGGIIGIALGILLGFLLGKVAMFFINTYYSDYSGFLIMNVHPSLLAILLSVCFSMLIGIFFGSYPAKKAAGMEVIDALRYE